VGARLWPSWAAAARTGRDRPRSSAPEGTCGRWLLPQRVGKHDEHPTGSPCVAKFAMRHGRPSPRWKVRVCAPRCCSLAGADGLAVILSLTAWTAWTAWTVATRFSSEAWLESLQLLARSSQFATPAQLNPVRRFPFVSLATAMHVLTLAESIAGTLMALGWRTRRMALGLLIIAAMGIVIIHWRRGWFVGEHGSGGMEYSVSLMVSLLVIAAADAATKEKVGTLPARGA